MTDRLQGLHFPLHQLPLPLSAPPPPCTHLVHHSSDCLILVQITSPLILSPPLLPFSACAALWCTTPLTVSFLSTSPPPLIPPPSSVPRTLRTAHLPLHSLCCSLVHHPSDSLMLVYITASKLDDVSGPTVQRLLESFSHPAVDHLVLRQVSVVAMTASGEGWTSARLKGGPLPLSSTGSSPSAHLQWTPGSAAGECCTG